MKRVSKELREQILELYLRDAMAGTKLAMEHGLTGAYAYKLANARGLLPLTRHVPRGRDAVHTAEQLEVAA
jgi:transposase-like protein